MAEREVDVTVTMGEDEVLAGRLWCHRRRNTGSQTFAYNNDYLARPDAYALDPGLPLASGAQQTPANREIFGAFSDSAPDRWGRSYLEIADVILRNSPSAGADLRELWRRMAFSVLISNFDDHLRNHGFLRATAAGWTLSPAFDLNPDPRPGERLLSTALDFDDAEARVDLLLEVAGELRLTGAQALAVLGEVQRAVARWRTVAAQLGLPERELQLMAPAFEHQAAADARALLLA